MPGRISNLYPAIGTIVDRGRKNETRNCIIYRCQSGSWMAVPRFEDHYQGYRADNLRVDWRKLEMPK
jgi:hypothetical protein